MEELGVERKYLEPSSARRFSEVSGSYTYFADGDVLLAKITPCFENGKLGIARGLTNGVGFGSSEYIVFRPGPELYAEYLYYFLNRASFREEGAQRMAGAVGHKRVSLDFIESYKLPLPPLLEQRRIVTILDEAFEAIATAKANTERNLANAREAFERVLEHLCFCSTADAQTCSLEEVCEIRSTLVDPRLPSHIDAPHVGAGNIEAGSGRLQNVLTAREEGLISGKFAFTRGTVLYSKIRPYLRKVARPEFDGLCSADIYPLDPIEQRTTRDFLFYLLLTSDFTAYAERGSARAGMPKVNRDHLFAYRFPLPPLATQRTIAGKLDEIREQSEALTTMFASKLTALDELKQSLLHQAFTGALTSKSTDQQLQAVA